MSNTEGMSGENRHAGRRRFFAAVIAVSCIGAGFFLSGCEKNSEAPQVHTSPVASKPVKASSELPRYTTSDYMGEAFRIIVGALDDPNPHVRTKAIEVAIETRHLRLMPRVHRLLRDQHAPVRFLAALAVGDLQYTLAEPDVRQLLRDSDASVQIAAAYAMTRLGHSEYAKVYRNALGSSDQQVRANAALLLGKEGDRDSAQYLYWTLQQSDSSDMVILQCAEALAKLGDDDIYEKLWTRLISTYADDRVIGIRAMGALGNQKAQNALVTMLDDPVLEVRLAAAEQLGRLGSTMGQPEVAAAFEDKKLMADMDAEDARRVRVLAASAIGEIGTDKLVKYLPRLLRDESVFVRLAAAKAVFRAAMKNPAM